MTKLEFAAALTYCTLPTLKSYQGIAVFVNDDGTVIGGGMHSGDPNQTHETAIANLCFNLKDALLREIWCLTTYQPTPICKGIMNVRQMEEDRVVQLPPKKAFGSGSPIRICRSGTEPPADWKNNSKAWLEAVIKASDEKRLTPEAKKIYDSYNSCQWVTNRPLPQDIYDIFSRLPASAPPAPNSLTWEGDEIYMRLAFAMVGETWNPVVKWDPKDTSGERLGGNNVGALIVNQNQIVSWGLNLSAQNRTLHAETLAVLIYLRRNNASKLPAKCKIYTSLQPCKMCAAHIAQLGNNAEVVIGVRDGKLKTILDEPAKDRLNGCFEREGSLFVSPGNLSSQKVPAKDLEIVKGQSVGKELDKSGFGTQATTKIMSSKQDEALRANKKIGTPSSMGNTFAAYIKWLIQLRDSIKTQSSPNKNLLAAFTQSVELLKIIAVSGLATSYGMDAIMPLLDEIHKDESARIATA